ncbi:MAG: transcriptional regulator [Oscillospiraceae bacterium]|nr:transcriptional regulator [Oscillospiraceae bacterium]
MRQLTFPGFMARYVRGLSANNSGAIYALSREALRDNPRLREPLYLYALSTGREKVLLKAVRGTALRKEYEQMSALYSYEDLLEAFKTTPEKLPEGYRKVWMSFVSAAERTDRDSRVKALIRDRVNSLREEKHVSVYNISKNLDLNNSNLNDWLKNDTPGKVSLKTARAVLRYLDDPEMPDGRR